MPPRTSIGEFEQMVLLAVLRLQDEAEAPAVGRLLEQANRRRVSRGALYATLERLEEKGLLRWSSTGATPPRGGHRRRSFEVTAAGVAALRATRSALMTLWEGLDEVLAKR
jgi:DNA-binding PadR family transcriptional regulator